MILRFASNLKAIIKMTHSIRQNFNVESHNLMWKSILQTSFTKRIDKNILYTYLYKLWTKFYTLHSLSNWGIEWSTKSFATANKKFFKHKPVLFGSCPWRMDKFPFPLTPISIRLKWKGLKKLVQYWKSLKAQAICLWYFKNKGQYCKFNPHQGLHKNWHIQLMHTNLFVREKNSTIFVFK